MSWLTNKAWADLSSPRFSPKKTRAYEYLFPPDSPGKVAVVSGKHRTYLLYSITVVLIYHMNIGVRQQLSTASALFFQDWIKEQATSGFQAFIVHYRDDPDQQNLIDWMQEGWVRPATSYCISFQGTRSGFSGLTC